MSTTDDDPQADDPSVDPSDVALDGGHDDDTDAFEHRLSREEEEADLRQELAALRDGEA